MPRLPKPSASVFADTGCKKEGIVRATAFGGDPANIDFREWADLIERVLAAVPGRSREILRRLYLLEQEQDQVCSEMSLTDTQFRLLKSRAKARLGELGERKRQSDPATKELVNIPPGLARVLPVIAHAVAVFGDENKASHWLATRLPLLGGRSPLQILEGQEGIDLVEQVLTRIEHNIPS